MPKRRNNRRSKSEIRLVKLLRERMPDIRIIPNERETCEGYEIDVCIPEHKLGIEWNGPLHRIPIYGHPKLAGVKKNDDAKRKILAAKGWMLVVIDDMDSKKPLQYAKKACSLVCQLILREKIKPGAVLRLEIGAPRVTNTAKPS